MFWWLRFLDVLASIKVDQCIGGYRISAGKISKFDSHIFTLMFKTFTDLFRCNTKGEKIQRMMKMEANNSVLFTIGSIC